MFGSLFKTRNLWSAAKRGDTRAIREFVANGADVNGKKISFEWAPLHFAARAGRIEAIKVLVELGANVNDRGSDGETPLICAVGERTNLNVIDCLLNHGADINKPEKGGATVLSHAAAYGDEKTVLHLLSRGANSDGATGKNYLRSPLVEAAGSKNIKIVEALLEAGATPNSAKGKDSALGVAALYGQLDMVRLLLSKGADPNHRDDSNHTPLRSAVTGESVAVVKALLAAGAEVNVKGCDGESILDHAWRFKLVEIAKLLESAGAKRSAELKYSDSPVESGTFWELNDGVVLSASVAPWPPQQGSATLEIEITEDDYNNSFAGTLCYQITGDGNSLPEWIPLGRSKVDEDGNVLFSVEIALQKGKNIIHFRILPRDAKNPIDPDEWPIEVI